MLKTVAAVVAAVILLAAMPLATPVTDRLGTGDGAATS